MSHFAFNSASARVKKAQAARQFSAGPIAIVMIVAGLFLACGVGLILAGNHFGYSLVGVTILLATAITWVRRDLQKLPPAALGSTTDLDRLLPANLVALYDPTMSLADLIRLLSGTPEGRFLLLRYGLASDQVIAAAGTTPLNHDNLWTETERLSQALEITRISAATALCALFHLIPALEALLTASKLTLADFDEGAHWEARLESYASARKPIYGGIARDWASGYTPLLAQFAENLSQQIEFAGKHFRSRERTAQLDTLITSLSSASGSVVLVGEPGIGKTALLYGLSDRLLTGQDAGALKHHQVMSLNASLILSNVTGVGDLERTVLELLSEAAHAGNIIIALDEAQLFFGQGAGAVNLSQIMLPVLQSRSINLVLAVTPGDWQKLRATNAALSSLLTPLVLSEPGQSETLRVTADRAMLIEGSGIITTWPAVMEAYRLSGRYLQDESYPGKAIKVLEAALNYPEGPFVTPRSVQLAIEGQFGVRVQQAQGAESDVLLKLEDRIHERMINQTRAVGVVANALRRARAGVANPHRPIGSFLFLGPTGVGKTELAKSLAALYFGSEASIIRLDMSEYQQPSDIDRILQSGTENSQSLLPKIRQAPFSVVLFDEIEKADPGILNLFLQLLDEGGLTDVDGKSASFKDAIIIATSNAGADDIRRRIEAGEQLESFEQEFTNDLINSGAFRPELLNRFDEIVLFRPLNPDELGQVVNLMVAEVNGTLANQKITVELADDAVAQLVKAGYDPRLGARPMRRMVTRQVEDAVAGMILRGEAQPGSVIHLDAAHLASLAPTPTQPQPASATTTDQ